MNILLIHQNFPGQFKYLAPALVARGHRVVALPLRNAPAQTWQGVDVRPYRVSRGSTPGIHPWVTDFETKTIRAEACFRAALQLRDVDGFHPDVIVAHPGWGESLFLKDVWPAARLGLYCEFYYRPEGADTNFDPEFTSTDPGGVCRIRLKNLNNLLHFEVAQAGLSPTHWQASTYPEPFRSRITVAHDGIDTRQIAPNPAAVLTLPRGEDQALSFSRQDEVITFVNRNLEPYRGFHIFMRALPELLRRRPQAQVIVVGGDGVSYGSRPDPQVHGAGTWREVYTREVRDRIPDADWARVHFVGHLDRASFTQLLQVSRVHLYLTYPFVLSWSLLEAMSAGCAIVGSNTTPLHEAIEHGRTGLLVDFFDPAALVQAVHHLLEDPVQRQRLGEQARARALERYDLLTVCLPQQVAWVEGLGNLKA